MILKLHYCKWMQLQKILKIKKKQEAEKFNNYISSLIDENGPNFDPSFSGLAYKLLTTDSLAQLLVAFEYFKHGRPARWFEAEDKA